MSGIFNIFNEQENAPVAFNNRGKQNLLLKSAGSVEMLPTKLIGQQQSSFKPKGLSVRSKSDLNVSGFNSFGANRLNPKNAKPISKDKQSLSTRSLSPIKLLTPKKKVENYAAKRLSPKISSPIMQNVVDDFVFRRPATPKDFKKPVYPAPEKLAYFEDPGSMIDEFDKSIFAEDARLLKSLNKSNESIISYEEDSGFISDHSLESFDCSTGLNLSLPSLPSMSDMELPEISDSDDD